MRAKTTEEAKKRQKREQEKNRSRGVDNQFLKANFYMMTLPTPSHGWST
jgi:hypothetical protein